MLNLQNERFKTFFSALTDKLHILQHRKLTGVYRDG